VLAAAGIRCDVCPTLDQLCQAVALESASTVILPEEAVLSDEADLLARRLREQPVWSDLPVIVLTRSGVESSAVERATATLGNVSLIERPMRVSTLLSVVRAALRARERQFQLRDHLEERVRAEAALRAARNEAVTANRAKDKFLAVLSHELRTPLTPVAMAATAMEMDPRLAPEFRDEMSMIRRNIDLETRLIDDLLDLSRVISGKFQIDPQPTEVHGLIHHVLEMLGPELHEKTLTVEQHLLATRDRVEGDPARLQQTLWNLLKNAAKFSDAGGKIVVRTRNESESVVVEVADTGKGIGQDLLHRIFDPFEQGEADVTRHFGGMGLGLSIAKAVVDLHGGTIEGASDGPGRGAVFTVRLPLAGAVDGGGGGARARAIPSTGGRPADAGAGRLRLLLVEDHVDTANILVKLLRLDGSDVRWAGSVEAALKMADAEGPFDVAVSDLGLPDGTGYDLMRQLRQQHPAVAGIAMSGYGMEDDVRLSADAGFVEHLVKPVSVPRLREAIRRAAAAARANLRPAERP
jgi:signal transduction histidine kinase/ActR/RegA family two-component response regulator